MNNLPQKKIGKFKASKMIAEVCWDLLKKDKEIMLFPIFAFITNIVILFAVGLFIFFSSFGGDWQAFVAYEEDSTIDNAQYLYTLLFYVVSYFIVSFFEVGIVAIVNGRLKGKNLTFMDGIRGAQRIVGKILVWSLISATVGMILRMIADRVPAIGKLVVMLLGAGWNILTYFVVPILYLEDMKIEDSLKRSAETIKRTWGETAIFHLGVGLYFIILAFGGISVGIMLMVMLEGLAAGIIGITLAVYVITLAVTASAFGSIFRVVLYIYATTGQVPEGFSKEVIELAFKKKK